MGACGNHKAGRSVAGTLQLGTLLPSLVCSSVGVTGIGHDDSRVALYQDADGDRGIIAVEVSRCCKPCSDMHLPEQHHITPTAAARASNRHHTCSCSS